VGFRDQGTGSRVCARVYVRACVRVCVCACVRVRVRQISELHSFAASGQIYIHIQYTYIYRQIYIHELYTYIHELCTYIHELYTIRFQNFE
jgi:hypothetical protein